MNVTREKSALLSLETRGDDAERLAVWLTTFLGEDVFRRLEENENLHVSMLEEKKDVTGWLTAGLKTILKSEDLELLVQRVEREIQELQKRLIVAEEIQVSNQDITADCERQKREIEALEVKLEPLQREVNSLKKKVAASVGIDVVVDAVFSRRSRGDSDHKSAVERGYKESFRGFVCLLRGAGKDLGNFGELCRKRVRRKRKWKFCMPP